ncbi:MAG: class I SAM-dependent methyltransferase [Deltaproteobacteria bacterium]|nr:class I SAM-dependent methyltransferase [Deltaproteobacteria bacterium]
MKEGSVSGWELFKFSLSLGAGYYRKGHGKLLHREAMRRLLTPINVSRCYEFRRTFELLLPKSGELVFDLSSPKLLSHFLSERQGCRVIAADMNKEEVYDWTSLTRERENLPSWIIADGVCLGIKDDTFDKVYSISVLEHIPGDGDTKTMKELARVLKPGGRLVVTVPYATRHRSERARKDVYNLHREKTGVFHWSHFYDEPSLRKKLIEGSGLELEGVYFGYGPGSALWKKIERMGRYGFPLWLFSMIIEKYGLRESSFQPAFLEDDQFLAAVAVLRKEKKH